MASRMNWNRAKIPRVYEIAQGERAGVNQVGYHADYRWRNRSVRKRWPIKCRACAKKSAVWMTRDDLYRSRFRCSACGGECYCPAVLSA